MQAPLRKVAALAIPAAWAVAVVWRHGQPGGVNVEWLTLPLLLAPSVLAGFFPNVERGRLAWSLALSAGALVALLARSASLAAGLGALSCAVLSLPPLRQPPAEPNPAAALGLALPALGLMSWGVWADRPLGLLRWALLLPVLWEALRGPSEPRAWLRRLALVGAALGLMGARFEPLLGLAAGLWGFGVSRWVRAERSRRSVFRVALPLVIAAGCLFTGELLHALLSTRPAAVRPPQEDLSQLAQPGAEIEWRGAMEGVEPHVIRLNSTGWHDREHRAKPPQVKRVLVLGDSFVEGIHVEVEQLYHLRLQEALGPGFECLALGRSGWGQLQELEALERSGWSLQPDLVLVEFLPGNDVRNNDPELERELERLALRSTWLRPLELDARQKRLAGLAELCGRLGASLRRLRAERDRAEGAFLREPPPHWAAAWQKTEDLFRQLRDRCQAQEVELRVVLFPSLAEIAQARRGAPAQLLPPSERLGAFCQREGIVLLDLTPAFARSEACESLYIPGDGHWTAAGHDFAARETAAQLQPTLATSPREQ